VEEILRIGVGKERRKKKVTTAAKYNGLPITMGGHKYSLRTDTL